MAQLGLDLLAHPILSKYKFVMFVVNDTYEDGCALTSDIRELNVDAMHHKSHRMVCDTFNKINEYIEHLPDHPDPSERVRPIKPENN